MPFLDSDVRESKSTLHLPRILCLHGGGTNARIFRAQCRAISAHLAKDFRLVFAEAAYPSDAGPDVLSVYKDWGPFKRWLRWLPGHPDPGPEAIVARLDQSLEDAMLLDDMHGATGEWAGVLGFSQGAKVSASLLYRQQRQEAIYGQGSARTSFQFGVILAGRGPLVCFDPATALPDSGLPDAARITDPTASHILAKPLGPHAIIAGTGGNGGNGGNILRIPTLHVHGMKDPGLELHQRLFDDFCEPSSRRLVVWDGDHRLPLKSNDVARVVKEIRELARITNVSDV